MFERLAPHDHACFLYEARPELLSAVSSFTRGGLESDDLTVFVHSFSSNEEALDFLSKDELDFENLLGSEFFVVSFYRDAFEGTGDAIDYAHVTSVVDGILEQSQKRNKAGVRIIVDASRIYLTGGREHEWFAFERWLGTRLHHRVGLVCAYDASTVLTPARRAAVIDTHLYRFGEAA